MNDHSRLALLVVAGCLVVTSIVIVGGVSSCIVYAREIVEGRFVCDQKDRLFDLLNGLLTTSMALYVASRGIK